MEIQRKIAMLMGELGIKAKNLAEAISMPQPKLSKIINGIQKPTPSELMSIAKVLKVEPEYLQTEEEYSPARFIPVVGTASCGVPDSSIVDELDMKEIPNTLFTTTAYAVTADGDSMMPVIENGDTLICDNKPIKDGDIVHYTIESTGESGVKRYTMSDGLIMLLPENKNYRPIAIYKGDSIKVSRVMAIVHQITTL